MIVYVESNFILELAYAQEGSESCEHILALAEAGRAIVAVPAFCLSEPYESWVRRSKQRRELSVRLSQEIGELSRSKPYAEAIKSYQDMTRTLVQSGEEEKQRLDAVIGRIVETATIIPLDRDTTKAALRLRGERSLSPQDAIVYASVLGAHGERVGRSQVLPDQELQGFREP